MTQYLSVKTNSLLMRVEGAFIVRGDVFPGLCDPSDSSLYDCPDDSYCSHIGVPTALSRGAIVPVEDELRNLVHKRLYEDPLMGDPFYPEWKYTPKYTLNNLREEAIRVQLSQ
jgi:hypothetical protein